MLTKEKKAAYDKIHRQAIRDKTIIQSSNYYQEHREELLARERVYKKTEKGKSVRQRAQLNLRCKKVGITIDHYNALPKKCSFVRCTATTPGGRGDWHLDHDHKTGKFRGLLCSKHNTQLGTYEKVKEDAEEYLSTR